MYGRVYMHYAYRKVRIKYGIVYFRIGVKEMGISDARKRANDKWRDKFDEIRFRVPKGKKEVIQQFAAGNGESVNAFINRLVDEAMEKDKKK